MKTISRFVWLTAFAALVAFAPKDAFALSAVVQQIQGEVLVQKTGGAEAWQAVTTDTVLANGDSVMTRKGSCSLVYSDQATFAVEENTTVKVQETDAAMDLDLTIGKIRGKVNHEKVTKPFEVVTPAAVATVRGTEVDFGFNDQGQLTVDLHNGKIGVVNEDADLKLDLDGKKSIVVRFDKEANIIHIKNDCSSDGQITFNVLGAEYAESPCEEREVSLSTAEKGNEVPNTNSNADNTENVDEGREPISPTT